MRKYLISGIEDVADADIGEVVLAVVLLPPMIVGGLLLKLYRFLSS